MTCSASQALQSFLASLFHALGSALALYVCEAGSLHFLDKWRACFAKQSITSSLNGIVFGVIALARLEGIKEITTGFIKKLNSITRAGKF